MHVASHGDMAAGAGRRLMPSTEAGGNALIDGLAEPERRALKSERVPLKQGTILHRFGTPTTQYLFPLSGMISLTVPTPAGDNVEVALVGREGVFGIGGLMGNPATDLEAIAQVEGEAIAVAAADINDGLRSSLLPALNRYAAMLLAELAQTAACNRVHTVEERTARWLLHAGDRAETSELQLTHEFMAMMLGVRRASVTVVVGGFGAAGLIVAERRRINLADPEGLREYACSCYEVIRQLTASAKN